MKNQVLVLEDKDYFCYLLKDLLSTEDYEIICCADMQTAEQFLSEQPFKLITLNWHSPFINCNEAFKKLNQAAPAIPVVLIQNKIVAPKTPPQHQKVQANRIKFRLVPEVFRPRINGSKQRRLAASD